MKVNFQCISENRSFVFSCSILFALLSLPTLFYDKITIFLFLNTIHHPNIDVVMLFITYCGTGFFTLIVFGVAWLAKKRTLALNILWTFLISGFLVHVLKPLYKAPRPKAIISTDSYSWFFEGITHSGLTSFPSGHATTIFTLCTLLTLSCRNKFLAMPFFIFAVIVSYSRVYIGQHFMEDVLVGAMLGTLSALAFYVFPKSDLSFTFKRLLPTKQIFDQWISNLR